MHYISDTHSLVWYFTKSDKLSSKALKIFETADKGEDIIFIPAIVLVELLYIVEKKKIELKFNDLMEKIELSENYLVTPLDLILIKNLPKLSDIKEMHDRIITATAQIYNAPVITKDDRIIASKLVKTIW